jgi:hypothetical protein
VPQDKRVYLDLGNAHEVVRVLLNGTELPVHAWPPYLWDVTASFKSGVNTLEIQVRTAPPAEQRGSFGGGAPGGAGGRRGGPGAPGAEVSAARGPAPTGIPPGGGARGPSSAPAPVAASGLLGPVRVLAQ